jgi:hypothetical protein
MTATNLPDPSVADPSNPAPYGAQTPRSSGPLVFWSALYVLWLAFLVVMAFAVRGR